MSWCPFAYKGITGSIFLALARSLGETMAVTMVIGNDPKINASLFAPGYSIAAVIANEFTEATGDLYTSALIELGLVLFALTIVINGAARLMIVASRQVQGGNRWPDASTHCRRKTVNAVMLTLTGVCTLFAAGTLVFILGYLFVHGANSLSWDFFTKLPTPVGESGGGMANAIVGSAKLLLVGDRCSASPSDSWAAFTWRSSAATRFPTSSAMSRICLNGVPSIVIGIFAYTLIVLPQKHFSTLAGGLALGVMMIPDRHPQLGRVSARRPHRSREGAMALGASKAKAILTVVIPAAKNGIMTGIMLNLARVAGETAPLLFTSFGNRYWSPGWEQPTVGACR